ncbi:MAG: Isochorismatase family protein [Gemmataceae bacterium]|nr:Isochorismatase family protein [Gemmataceae bacterium]
MTKATKRLRSDNSVLVVIDVQEKLLAKIPTAAALVRTAGFLLDAAGLLGVPVRATEQYPQGLGPTVPELAGRLSRPAAKTAFSCCGAGTFLEELEMLQRPNVVLVGMETHVCVMQTALDLIAAGLHVFLPVDALATRFPVDHDTALRRLEYAGAVPTTAEAVAFEWVCDASHPQFKAVSKLVIDLAAGRGQ